MTSPAAGPSPLDALAATLRQQAAGGGTVTLSGDVLPPAQAGAIAAAFGLGVGTSLTVGGVRPSDVPDPAGRAVRVTAGTATLFGRPMAVDLLFTLDDAG